jgi:hypothetical protein
MEINNTVLALPTMNSFIKLLLNVIPCDLLIPPFSQNIKILSFIKYKNPSFIKYKNPSFIKYKNPSFIKYKNPSFIKYKNPSFIKYKTLHLQL